MRYLMLLPLACGLTAACGNPSGLTAYISNSDTTASLYALSGTPVSLPSGYSIPARQAVRTDAASAFDFAFDIDTAGRTADQYAEVRLDQVCADGQLRSR